MCHTRAARINHLALYLIEVDVWINRSDHRPSISTEKQKVSCVRYTIYIVADVDIILLNNMQWHVIMLKFLYLSQCLHYSCNPHSRHEWYDEV